MFDIFFSFYFLIPYIVFNIICSYLLYKRQNKFFVPKYITDKSGRTINIHESYPEWKQYKEISYFRYLFGFTFFVWIRLFTFIFLLFCLWAILKLLSLKGKSDRRIRYSINVSIKVVIGMVLWLFGLVATKKRLQPNDLYSYYLGAGNYNNFDKDYSLIISNHISWFEILYILCHFVPGFISKATVKKVPMLGFITENIESMFLDRANEENRNLIV